MRHPLRKVIERGVMPEHGAAPRELLECGHVRTQKSDAYGLTFPSRRRCRECDPEESFAAWHGRARQYAESTYGLRRVRIDVWKERFALGETPEAAAKSVNDYRVAYG